MSSRLTWVALLLGAALLVAGCGGGDDETTESTAATTAPAALTKAELLEQGDAICAEVNAAVGTVGTSSEEGSGPAAQAASLYSGMVASLQNLGTPQETTGYAEFSGAAEELAKTEGEVKLAAEREEGEALGTAESNASTALEAFQEAAEEYGFEECSQGPSAPVPSGEGGEAESGGGEEGGVEVAPETIEPEAAEPEAAPEPAPETGGGAGAVEGGGVGGGTEGGGGSGGSSGGIGPG